ncbi:UvrD-helicase domain-containing protein [Actinoplanes sp. CA-252034]|uniref:UvrD-helicase domain-containing protein n=1 Tax=Actinoplanes sp. CA-252034 TaxID=3239906 RepID=UPI003D98318A
MSTPVSLPPVRRPTYRLVRRPRPVAPALPADPVQRRVVGHTSGPLLVVGGPGTGKTSVLVESVAARIAEGTDPERILVLTFGRRSAAALRDRIEARIADDPGRIVHEPLVRTFHAYAFGLLRRAAAERGEPSPRLLTGPEQDLIIRELLAVVADPEATDEIGWPESLRPALPTRAFAQQLRDLMQRAAERGVGPVELARLGERLGRDDWPAAARFLREYVAVLALRDVTTRGSAAYDPAELVRAASGLLSDDPGLLEAERRRLAHVYVDELAETDPAQVDLLAQVAGGGKSLIAFADPDSSIYGFRGADPAVVTAFPPRFRSISGAPAETVVLHTNYRAAPPLLTATTRVTRRMRGPMGRRFMQPPPPTAVPSPSTSAAPPAPDAPVSPGSPVSPGGPASPSAPVSPGTPVSPGGPLSAGVPLSPGASTASAPEGTTASESASAPGAADGSSSAGVPGVAVGSSSAGVPGVPAGPSSAGVPGVPAGPSPGGVPGVAVGSSSGGVPGVAVGSSSGGVPGVAVGSSSGGVPGVAVGSSSGGVPGVAVGSSSGGVPGVAVGSSSGGVPGVPAGPSPAGAPGVAAGSPTAGTPGIADAEVDFGPVPGAVVRTFRSTAAETAYIAHALREAHLLHGVPWSRMAVLMRSTTLQQPSVQRALAAAGVPTIIHAEDLPLHLQPAVAPFLLLLRCAVDPAALNEEAAVALLHSPLGGADPLAERRLRQGLRALAISAGDRRPSGELLVDAVRDPAGLDLVERRWARPAQTVARLLTVAREAAAEPGASAEQVLWTVWRESGLHDRWYAMSTGNTPMPDQRDSARAREWRSEAADRDLDAMVVLFDAAARFVDRLPGAGVAVFLDHVLGQDLPADSIAPSADRGEAVRLLTAHAAKGLEWDVVIIAGVQEGIWPDLRLRGSLLGSERLVDVLAGRPATGPEAILGETSALLDEERRLFYVATTRARRRLVVTAVASASVGGSVGEEQPSRFLTELATPRRGPGGELPPGPPQPDPWDTGPPDIPAHPTGGAPSPDDDGRPETTSPPHNAEPDPSGGEALVQEDDQSSDRDHQATDADAPRLTGGNGLGPAGGDGPVPGDGPSRGRDGDAEPAPAGDGLETDGEVELPVGRPPRALTLASLVAELRTVVVGSAETPSRRRAAAAELARLAAAGVPGAHPDEWWGLRPLSDDRPLVDEGEPVKVTPSSMESALRCSLRWLLERHGGAAPAGPAQGIGNLVHAAAMLAEDANADREKLVEYVSARFDSIELAAQWLAGPEQDRAQAMVDKLLRWLAVNPRRLLAIEHEFTVRLEDERNPIQLTGRVDRLEVDEAGRLVVIDLKTGKTTAVSAADVAENAQLGGYQAAIDAGAFADFGTDSGGAALVQLGPGKDAREQMQVPLTEAADPGWADGMVRRTAAAMAASTFSAVANSRCRVCPVRTSCPISGKGRQVVEPNGPDQDR